MHFLLQKSTFFKTFFWVTFLNVLDGKQKRELFTAPHLKFKFKFLIFNDVLFTNFQCTMHSSTTCISSKYPSTIVNVI